MEHARFKLVEAYAGVGDLMRDEEVLSRVSYRIDRYQGMSERSGMPIPGLHRIEGALDLNGTEPPPELVGQTLTLKLEDGRSLRIRLADAHGAVLAEGHGPGLGCSCC